MNARMVFLDEIADRINAHFFYDKGITGDGVKIAVVDSGVNEGHEMLKRKVFFRKEITPGRGDPHGTWVASACAGRTVTFKGHTFSGIAPNALVADIKVLDENGNGSMSQVMEGIYTAIDKRCDILNLSLGAPYDDAGESPVSVACDLASSKGIVVVAASGNSMTPNTPSTANTVIAVGANTTDDFVSSYSGRGPTRKKYPYPTLTSYGGEIGEEYIVAAGNEGYVGMIGTSASTPIVSGIIALFIEYIRKYGINTTIQDFIRSNTTDIEEEGIDWESGYGRTLIGAGGIQEKEYVRSSTSLPLLLIPAVVYMALKFSPKRNYLFKPL